MNAGLADILDLNLDARNTLRELVDSDSDLCKDGKVMHVHA
jgi:hypothetical protein